MKRLRKILHKSLSLLPAEWHRAVLRKAIHLDRDLPKDYTIGVVQNAADMESALRILHDSYVEQGFMDPDPSGMRILPQHAIVTTTLLVVKIGNEVIGTVSLIRDNPIGLPMDSSFDLSTLRSRGLRITEISSLAFKSEYRNSHGKFLFPLFKYVNVYSEKIAPCDCLVLACHPNMAWMYEALLLFQKVPAAHIKNYKFVNGVEAVGVYLIFADFREQFPKVFANISDPKKDFYQYMTTQDFEQLHYPERPFFKAIDSILTPEIIQYFFMEKSNALSSLSMENKLKLNLFYQGSNLEAEARRLCENTAVINFRRFFRYETKCQARIIHRNNFSESADVVQVSREGILLRMKSKNIPEDRLRLEITVGPEKSLELSAKIAWFSNGILGLRILDSPPLWSEYLDYLESGITQALPQKLRKVG